MSATPVVSPSLTIVLMYCIRPRVSVCVCVGGGGEGRCWNKRRLDLGVVCSWAFEQKLRVRSTTRCVHGDPWPTVPCRGSSFSAWPVVTLNCSATVGIGGSLWELRRPPGGLQARKESGGTPPPTCSKIARPDVRLTRSRDPVSPCVYPDQHFCRTQRRVLVIKCCWVLHIPVRLTVNTPVL